MDKVNEYITIKEAAKILGVSKITLRNWDKAGKLQAHRHPLNNYRIYKTGDIEKITIKEAAKILGVSKITLRNWDKAGKLQAHRHPLNNYRIYKTGDIEK